MDNLTTIIKSDTVLSPYKFYTEFLVDVAQVYRDKPEKIRFKLFENGDDKIYDSNYRIDPISIPLLLSLFEQLSKFHNQPLNLQLYNNAATLPVLEFMDRAGFFRISGAQNFYTQPQGRNILNFDTGFLGSFSDKRQRSDHKVRV